MTPLKAAGTQGIHLDVESGSAGFRGNGLRPSLRLASEWELPGDLSLGVMPGVILDRDQHGRRYTAGIVGIVLGKAWNERLHTFVEIAAPQIARARDGGSQLSLDIGMGYLITPLIQFDMALSRGLNKNTADLTLSIGLSRKF